MNYTAAVELIFEAIPEFKIFYTEELNEDYYNSFLGDFGIFTRDAILYRKNYAERCLVFINDLVNQNINNKEFTNLMTINVLEILTDYADSQKISTKYFDKNCLNIFNDLLGSYFNDLRNI